MQDAAEQPVLGGPGGELGLGSHRFERGSTGRANSEADHARGLCGGALQAVGGRATLAIMFDVPFPVHVLHDLDPFIPSATRALLVILLTRTRTVFFLLYFFFVYLESKGCYPYPSSASPSFNHIQTLVELWPLK